MGTQSSNPMTRFFRSLFGFPEGEPGSCSCSGDPAAAEAAQRVKDKAEDKRGCGNEDAPETPAQPVARRPG